MGNESATLRWSFAPRASERYSARVSLVVRSVNTSRAAQRTALTVLAEGTEGAVQFEPAGLSFGTALVGTTASEELMLINSADCDVAFELEVVRTDSLSEHHLPKGALKGQLPPLSFSKQSGLLPARSRLRTVATFCPKVRGDYSFKVLCRMKNAAKPSELDNPENTLARTLSQARSNPNA